VTSKDLVAWGKVLAGNWTVQQAMRLDSVRVATPTNRDAQRVPSFPLDTASENFIRFAVPEALIH